MRPAPKPGLLGVGSLSRLAVAVSTVALAACQEHQFEPPDREAQVEEADQLYASARFDSLTWASDSVRLQRGNSVYASECRQCHGPLGRGDTEYAEEHGIEIPSLVEEAWIYADDLDGARHRIFIGHADGMPTWGIAGISNREIDAAAYYVLTQLRPDVLEGGAAMPGERRTTPPDTAGDGAD